MAQHDNASSTPYDLLGVGFGPSNLALAIALREQKARLGRPLRSLFIDRQSDYRWHGNTLVTQSELQISFLKDLVTLRNPTSPFSFVNYLHSQGRLVDFTNLGTFYPCRLEFNDYLRWVAEHFADQSRYGEEVVRVEPAPPEADGTIRQLEVVARDAEGSERRYRTRALALSTGGTPRIPQVFRALRQCPQVFHHAQYLERVAALPCAQREPMRIAVVGGGQSAAEAFIDLNDSYPHVKVDMVLRGAVLKPADDSPFVNEIFAPEYTDLVFNQPPEERERLINEYHNTNYSVVDLDLIERIYGILYRQKVAKSQRHGFLCRRSIEAAQAVDQQVELRLHDVATGAVENHRYDAVILATGYERMSHRHLLEPLAPLLQTFKVDRAYRLQTDQRLQAPIFLQGFCQHSHGLSDALLSVLPARAGEIAEALHATLESIVPHPPQAALADA